MLIIPATRAELPNPIRLCLLYQPQDQNYPQLMFNVYLPWRYGVWLPAMATCEIPLLFFDRYMTGIFCALHRGPPTVTFSQTFSLTTLWLQEDLWSIPAFKWMQFALSDCNCSLSSEQHSNCVEGFASKSTSLSLYCYTAACDKQVGHPRLFHASY